MWFLKLIFRRILRRIAIILSSAESARNAAKSSKVLCKKKNFLSNCHKNFAVGKIWLCFCDATVMKTIFILEDETGIRDALQLLLSFEDYDVRSFSTVEAFNNRDLSVVPDIFILDVMMPDGNGIDVCNELRIRPETSNIPIMIMSAHAKDHEVISRCNADEFISKPFDIDAVLLKIDNLLVTSN